MINLFWRLVFWWKRRTGWIDMGERIEVTGTVLSFGTPDVDGDRTLNLRLDPGQERYITGFGGRLTANDEVTSLGPSLHCEVPPWAHPDLLFAFDRLSREVGPGVRVRIGGRWGFDGVHTKTGRAEWLEVILALVRHQPNVREGWFEIHPVDKLELAP